MVMDMVAKEITSPLEASFSTAVMSLFDCAEAGDKKNSIMKDAVKRVEILRTILTTIVFLFSSGFLDNGIWQRFKAVFTFSAFFCLGCLSGESLISPFRDCPPRIFPSLRSFWRPRADS